MLGVAESRRSIGMIRSDLGGLEKEIRNLAGTAAGLGTSLTKLGASLVGFGRTLSIAVTLPIVALGGSMVKAGIQFEDAFAGVVKTVDGVAVGFREAFHYVPQLQAQYFQFLDTVRGTAAWADVIKDPVHAFILTLDEAERAMVYATPQFGQLTEAGAGLRQAFRELALEIPIPVNEIARVGEVAGQLGVPLGIGGQNLVQFTRIMAELGVATELSSDDAAFAIARFGNILGVTGEDLGDFASHMGNSIVALGNASAATEPEIAALALRIGAAGRLGNLAAPEILGLATTLADMGIKAERGGTAVSRVIEEMIMAIGEGGEGLEQFARIAGLSTTDFSNAFKKDAIGTVKLFMKQLAEVQETGAPGLKQALIDMGLSGIRVKEVIALLGLNMEQLDDNIALATQAWEEEIALQEEVQKRYKTTASQIQLMKNAFVDIGITIFDLYKDKLDRLIQGIRNFAREFSDLPTNVQRAMVTFGLLAAAIGPVTILLGLFLQNLGLVITALSALPRFLLQVAAALLLNLAPALAIVGTGAFLLYSIYESNFLGIKDLVNDLAKSFTWFYDTIIKPNLDSIGRAIKAGDWSAVVATIQGMFSSFGVWLDIAFTPKLKKWADDVGKTIHDKIKAWTENIPATVSNIAEKLGESVKKIGSSIANAVLSEEDQRTIDEFYDTIVGNFDRLRKWLDNNDGNLQTGLKKAWEGIKAFISNLSLIDVDAIADILAKAFGAAWIVGGVIMLAAGTILERVGPSISKILADVISSIDAFLKHDIKLLAGNISNLADSLLELGANLLGIGLSEETRAKIRDTIDVYLIQKMRELKTWYDENKQGIIDSIGLVWDSIRGFVKEFIAAVDWKQFARATENLLDAGLKLGLVLLLVGRFAGEKLLAALPGTGKILGEFFNALSATVETFTATNWEEFSQGLEDIGTSWKGFAEALSDNSVLSGILALIVIAKFIGAIKGLGAALGLTALANFFRVFAVTTIGPTISAAAAALWELSAPLLAISVLGLPLWGVLLVLALIAFAILAIHNNWLGMGDAWNSAKVKLDEAIIGIKESIDGLGIYISDWTLFKLPESFNGLDSELRINFKHPFVRNNLDIEQGFEDLGQAFKDFVAGIPGFFEGLEIALGTSLVGPFERAGTAIVNALQPVVDRINWILEKLGVIGTAEINAPTPQQGSAATYAGQQFQQQQGSPWEQFKDLLGFAQGGVFKGWGWVGENGPELMYSGLPSMVLPNGISQLIASESQLTNRIGQMIDRDYRGSGPNYAYYQPTFNGSPTIETRKANNDMYHQWLYSTGKA